MSSTQQLVLFLVGAILLAQQVYCQERPNFGQTFTLKAEMVMHEPPYPKQHIGYGTSLVWHASFSPNPLT